jgi:hypothetical protein
MEPPPVHNGWLQSSSPGGVQGAPRGARLRGEGGRNGRMQHGAPSVGDAWVQVQESPSHGCDSGKLVQSGGKSTGAAATRPRLLAGPALAGPNFPVHALEAQIDQTTYPGLARPGHPYAARRKESLALVLLTVHTAPTGLGEPVWSAPPAWISTPVPPPSTPHPRSSMRLWQKTPLAPIAISHPLKAPRMLHRSRLLHLDSCCSGLERQA